MTQKEKAALGRCGLFEKMTAEEIDRLISCLGGKTLPFKKNDIIWRIGDPIHACAVILSGRVRAETVNAAGTRTVTVLHGPGALVGDVLMATPGGKSPVYVIASENGALLLLPYSRIMGGCEKCCPCHQALRENLISEIARKYWMQRRRTEYLTARSLRQRIAMYLTDQEGTCFHLGISREELAGFLGANRSALSRELCRMKKEGILDFTRDTFHILDSAALERWAQ